MAESYQCPLGVCRKIPCATAWRARNPEISVILSPEAQGLEPGEAGISRLLACASGGRMLRRFFSKLLVWMVARGRMTLSLAA